VIYTLSLHAALPICQRAALDEHVHGMNRGERSTGVAPTNGHVDVPRAFYAWPILFVMRGQRHLSSCHGDHRRQCHTSQDSHELLHMTSYELRVRAALCRMARPPAIDCVLKKS